MSYTHTNVLKGGKGVPDRFNGTKIALECPEGDVAEGVGEGKLYATLRDLYRAANRTANVERNGIIREAIIANEKAEPDKKLSDEGVLAVAAQRARAFQFKARIVDPNAPKKAASSGEVKKAKEVSGRVDDGLLRAVRSGNNKGIKTMLEMGMVTQEQVDAARAKVAAEPVEAATAK